ncbi:MAG: hypothetical protein IJY24_05105 [Clostridia bacterium]|nr:hypothetical protein [Clostridia bacterium]
MQKLTLLLILALIIVCLGGCTIPSTEEVPLLLDGAAAVDSDEYYIGEDKVTVSPTSDAYLYTEYGVDLAFRFALERAEYDYLVDNFPDLSVLGRYMEYDGAEEIDPSSALLAEVIEERLTDEYAYFSVSVGGVMMEKYNTDYITLLEISFTDSLGESYTIRECSPASRVYNVALLEYTDRHAEENSRYQYFDGYGAYSPYNNLSIRRTVLYSTLHIELKDGKPRDLSVMDNYTSPYKLSYFDGILTVEMVSGADIDPELLKYIYINGENTYFSVYEGRIQLVVD